MPHSANMSESPWLLDLMSEDKKKYRSSLLHYGVITLLLLSQDLISYNYTSTISQRMPFLTGLQEASF